jgi:hypothetical protein
MSGKMDVNGAHRHALYAWLTAEENDSRRLGWNFAPPARASGILSAHSLTSPLYLNPAARRIRCFLD